MCQFIDRQEIMFVTDADGGRTFRCGPPGFVTVLERRRVAWRDEEGVASGPVGLLFVDLFDDVRKLQVDGVARTVRNGGESWVVVSIEDAFLHTPHRGLTLACHRS